MGIKTWKTIAINIFLIIVIISCVILMVYCIREVILEAPKFGLLFSVWSLAFVCLFPIFIPCYFRRIKNVLITPFQSFIYGLVFAFSLIILLSFEMNILFKGEKASLTVVNFLLIIGMIGASLFTWFFINALIWVWNKLLKKKNGTEIHKKTDYINARKYKCIVDYIAGGMTVLSLILLFSQRTDEQATVVNQLGSYFGGIMCAYDLLLSIIDDIYTYKHKKNEQCNVT